MSSANANSSSASKKEVKQELPLRVVGIGCSVKTKTNELEKEEYLEIGNTLDLLGLTEDLAKTVGSYTIVKDAKGNIVERVDEEKKIKYVTGKDGKIKARRMKEQPVK
ncbi:MAG: hypothetical protein IKD76_05890 [Clostridia bacterium]|nr:hypothetical protein [Clostridia bacterium]